MNDDEKNDRRNVVNVQKKRNKTKQNPHNFYPVENCCYLYVQHFVFCKDIYI